MGIAQALDTTSFQVEATNLLANRTSCEAGMASGEPQHSGKH